MHDIHAKSERRIRVRSAALEALSKRFRAALLGYFRRRVSDAAEAEDLVQEVLLRMLRRAEATCIEDPRGYLFETVSSVLIDRARRLAATDRDPPEDGSPAEDHDFESWMDASIQNRTAHERAQAIWHDFEAIVDPGELVALRSATLAKISQPRRWRVRAALGVVCLAGLAALFWSNDRFNVSTGPRPSDIAAVHAESARHEASSITSADRSIAALHDDSAVVLRPKQRLNDVAGEPLATTHVDADESTSRRSGSIKQSGSSR